MTDTINKARALLARWRGIGWSDDGSAPAYTTVAALIADLEAARAELAAARAAMPTAEEYERVADAFEGELMEAPKARREWLAAGAAWLDRMHAYHAAHHAASSDGTGRAGGGSHE